MKFLAAIKRNLASLLRFSSLNYVQVFPCAISPVCRLNYSRQLFFFSFLFSSFMLFFSIGLYVTIPVTGCCNQFSFLSILCVLELLYLSIPKYWKVYFIFLTNKHSDIFQLLSLMYRQQFPCSLFNLFGFLFCLF